MQHPTIDIIGLNRKVRFQAWPSQSYYFLHNRTSCECRNDKKHNCFPCLTTLLSVQMAQLYQARTTYFALFLYLYLHWPPFFH